MIIERQIKLSNFLLINILSKMSKDWHEYLYKNYNTSKLDKDFFKLLDEFLDDYALNTTEKSE